MSRRIELIVAALSAGLAFITYLGRLAPGLVLFGDSGVFVSAAATAGIPQPSGYPLYTLLGGAATLIPVGSVPTRVHALSALFHAATVGVLAAMILRTSRSGVAAVVGALAIGLSRPFLASSLYAEVFPLLDLTTALLLYAACRVRSEPAGSSAQHPLVLLTAGIQGLALSHHQMTALVLPSLVVLLWGKVPLRRMLRGRTGVRVVGLALGPPLLLHAALLPLALRDPAVSWGDLRTLGDLVRLVTRADYGGLLSPHLGTTSSPASEQIVVFMSNLWDSLGWTSLFALGGALALARRDRPLAMALTLAFVLAGPVFSILNRLDVSDAFGRANLERFSGISLLAVAPFIGEGLAELERFLRRATNPRLAASLLGLLTAVLVWLSRDVSLKTHALGANFARELVESSEDGALVLTTGDAATGASAYRCGVEGACGSRLVMAPGQLHLEWRVRQLARRHPELVLPEPAGRFVTVRELVAANLSRRPVYLMPSLIANEPALLEAFRYQPRGLLLRALPLDAAVDPSEAERRARDFHRSCRGCRRQPGFHSPLELPQTLVYVQALLNHSRTLTALGRSPELAEALHRAARALDAELVRKLD